MSKLITTLAFRLKPKEIISENEYLKPRAMRRGGRIVSWLYKPDYIKDYQKDLVQQIKSQLEEIPEASKFIGNKKLSLVIFNAFCLEKNFAKRDVTNAVKLYEDALKEALKIDDSRNMTVNSSKIEEESEQIVTIINFYE